MGVESQTLSDLRHVAEEQGKETALVSVRQLFEGLNLNHAQQNFEEQEYGKEEHEHRDKGERHVVEGLREPGDDGH